MPKGSRQNRKRILNLDHYDLAKG
jgi:Cdc6-like AAA superfamily ATPase